jgi:hypothetical protein
MSCEISVRSAGKKRKEIWTLHLYIQWIYNISEVGYVPEVLCVCVCVCVCVEYMTDDGQC